MLKMKELNELSSKELQGQHADICREIFHLTNELKSSRKLERPHELKEKKKDRARILTVLRQKQSQKQG